MELIISGVIVFVVAFNGFLFWDLKRQEREEKEREKRKKLLRIFREIAKENKEVEKILRREGLL